MNSGDKVQVGGLPAMRQYIQRRKTAWNTCKTSVIVVAVKFYKVEKLGGWRLVLNGLPLSFGWCRVNTLGAY